MDKVINCLFAAITLLLSARGEVFKGKLEGGGAEGFLERTVAASPGGTLAQFDPRFVWF